MVDTKYLKNNTVVIQVPKQVLKDNNRLANSTTDKGNISNDSIILKPTNNEKVKIINDGNWIQKALSKKEEQKGLPKRPVGRPAKDAPIQPNVKKPVGRPPAVKSKSPQQKRPRGRPRKQVAKPDNQDDYKGLVKSLANDINIVNDRIYSNWNTDIPLRLEVEAQQTQPSVINLLMPVPQLAQLPRKSKFILKPLPPRISAPAIPQSDLEQRPSIPEPVVVPDYPTSVPQMAKTGTPVQQAKSKSSEPRAWQARSQTEEEEEEIDLGQINYGSTTKSSAKSKSSEGPMAKTGPPVQQARSKSSEPRAWQARSQTEEEEEEIDLGHINYGSTTNSSAKSKSSEGPMAKVGPPVKASSNSIGKKTKAVGILKRLLYPFINRVSANITDRLLFYRKLRRILELKDIPKQGCFSYKGPNFVLGDTIILKKQIGSTSKSGIVYLSNIEDKPIYNFAVKISEENDTINKEIMLLQEVNKYVLKQENPHFPIIYGVFRCDDIKSEYTKLSQSEKSAFPELLTKLARNSKRNKAVSVLNELANGDLRSFINDYGLNDDLMTNALVQNLISIVSFHSATNHFHNDTHAGNFLYHKIKKGGYYHYKILDDDYYIENMGFLWVIWDYGLALPLTTSLKINLADDNHNLMANTRRTDNDGLIDNGLTTDTYDDLITKLMKDITGKKVVAYMGKFTVEKYKKYVANMLKVLKTNGLLLTSIPTSPINQEPFVITLPT